MLWVRIPLGARHTALCDTVCQWLTAGRWFFPGTPVSHNNKTDHHDITEILLKVALNICMILLYCPSLLSNISIVFSTLYYLEYVYSEHNVFHLDEIVKQANI